MKFSFDMRVQKLPTGRWILLEPLTYAGVMDEDGFEDITIPAGFDTDFASVPRLPLMFWILGDRADYAALLHDYLYRTARVTRAQADRAFRIVAGIEGVDWFSRWALWAGVRAGGWWSYDQRHQDNQPEEP